MHCKAFYVHLRTRGFMLAMDNKTLRHHETTVDLTSIGSFVHARIVARGI
jgi:hypothetical protein